MNDDVWLQLTADEVLRLPWISVDPARVVGEPAEGESRER